MTGERSGPPAGGPPAPGAVRLLAASMFTVSAVAMIVTEADYGVASDVSNYFFSSVRQLAWVKDLFNALLDGSPSDALNRESVIEHWRWMPFRLPHPPLSREISGVSWFLFRGLFDTLTAYRIGVMIAYAALTAGCAAFTAISAGSIRAGIGAGLSALTIPVLFAHGHLADTDLFLTAFWFGAAAFLYQWAEGGRGGHLLLSGILLGAALATKFTGLLIVPVLCLWVLLRRPRDLPWAIPLLGLIAAVVFFVSNPLLWVDPMLAMSDYLGAGLERAEEARSMLLTEYFGRIYEYRAPRHYPFVWTLIVLPPTILLAIIASLFDTKRAWLVGFCVLNASVLYAALMLPSAPMHDGVRLFLPAFAFFSVLAGVGVGYLVDRLERLAGPVSGRNTLVLATVLGLAIFLPAAGAVVRTHPYQLSYFNLLVGGTNGAAEKGLEVTNLKEVLNRDALQDLATSIPEDAVIDAGFFLEEICFNQFLDLAPRGWSAGTVWPTADPDQPDLALACEEYPIGEVIAVNEPVRDADFLLVLNRKALWRPIEWALYEQGGAPFYQATLDGVPLFSVYRLR